MEKLRLFIKEKKGSFIPPILIFLISFLIYYLTSFGKPTPFNNFVRLADAFIHGRLYILENVPWLELAVYNNKFYTVPPPMPAILIIPIVYFLGLDTNQTIASIFLGSLNALLAFLIARSVTKNKSVQLWATLMFVFGTIHWWVATSGDVWMFSQVTSVTFLFLAIYFSLKEKNPVLTGLLIGASYLSRLPTILSLPFFLAVYSDRWLEKSNEKVKTYKIIIKPLLLLGFGVGIFIILNFIYNYARFGTIFDKSYYLIPGILEESWYKKGIFDITYIPRHLNVILFAIPKFKSELPYIYPSWNGMSIWVTTPAFIYSFFAEIRNRLVIGCWISILLIAFADFTHGTWGFAQFGYRFAVDFYPFLFLLTIKGIGDEIKWYHKLLIIIGVLVNLWGVLWIFKFGWTWY